MTSWLMYRAMGYLTSPSLGVPHDVADDRALGPGVVVHARELLADEPALDRFVESRSSGFWYSEFRKIRCRRRSELPGPVSSLPGPIRASCAPDQGSVEVVAEGLVKGTQFGSECASEPSGDVSTIYGDQLDGLELAWIH